MSVMANNPGIHGKLPSHGDFITRRLSRDFVDGWDDWLQHAIAASKAQLGEQWLETYLTSPIWSFALEAGICGASAWAGVLMPSVDRVGRYFPLTLAVAVPDAVTPGEIMTRAQSWFERAHTVALSSLEEDNFSLDAFDESVADLGAPMDEATACARLELDEFAAPRGLHLPSMDGPLSALARLADGVIGQHFGRYSAWWSDGSELVAPCVLLSAGLPPADGYRALLDGRFSAEHWVVPASKSVNVPSVGAVE